MLLLSCLLLLPAVHGGHFLFWLPMSSKSVKIAAIEPGYELARRGHTVTVVCPNKAKKEIPGITEIINISELDQLQNEMTEKQLVEKAEIPIMSFIEVSIDNNRHALEMEEVRALLGDKVKVDVVVVVPAFANEAGYHIAHRKNASLVTFMPVPFGVPPINWAIGDSFNPSYIPMMVTGYSSEMSFKERCINTLVTAATKLMVDLYARPKIQAMVQEQFPGETLPSLHDLSLTTALHINLGSPFMGDGVRPVMPKSIMAGLMTCRPGLPLPPDLAAFVEGAEHGVIYISFGSVIKSSLMPEDKRQLLLSLFSSLKQRVIWKWEAAMPDAPPNVMVSSWLPQQDLLAHPKVVLFITHGGAGSIQETVCHKTPIVGIPISMDQHLNVADAVQAGLGLKQEWHGLEGPALLAAVREVLSNPSYGAAVARLSHRIMDTPQHPLDRAVWWLEYLLRHPGNPGMLSPALKLAWHQYFLLDVLAFFLAILLLIGFLLKRLVSLCRGGGKRKED